MPAEHRPVAPPVTAELSLLSGAGDLEVVEQALTPPPGSALGRAVLITTAATVLVPVIGLVTQPLLSNALGAQGRGLVAAATAPGLLVASLAALGLPEAVTFLIAKDPARSRRVLGVAAGLSAVVGAVCCGSAYFALGYLSGHDEELARLILFGLLITIPGLVFATVRAAARGHQMWVLAAVDSTATAVLKLLALLALFATGHLDVLSAVLAITLTQLVATALYALPLRRLHRAAAGQQREAALARRMLSYGSRTWLGSVAGMVLARADQVLMVPLASSTDLGLYAVAVTVSDAPIVFVLAVAGALFGVNSRSSSVDEVATTSRIALMLSAVLCTALALTAGLFIGPLFGADFRAAAGATRILLLAQLLWVPAVITGTGLATHGRPGMRSAALVVTVVVNVGLLFLLVPALGVTGACWAAVAGSLVNSVLGVAIAVRILHVPASAFLVPRRSDVALVLGVPRHLLARARRRGAGAPTG